MSAATSVSRSKPRPVIWRPRKCSPSRRNASGFMSMTATLCSRRSSSWASVEPTRPHPMMTMCTSGTSPSAHARRRRRKRHPGVTTLHNAGAGYDLAGASGPRTAGHGRFAPNAPYGAAVSIVTRVAKRLIIGSPVRSDRMGHSLLPKRLALPIFASDPLSSVAYATQEILLVLTVGGTAFLYLAPWIAAAVIVLMVAVVASYRQLVRAYPTGGGDYEVASKNLGRSAGVVVATVLLAAVNLRGLREAGLAFAAPTYLFATGVFVMIATGLFRAIAGDRPVAESAHYVPHVHSGYGSLGLLALCFLTLRAFSSGCTALTGVEAIANGVPAFKPPKARNAQRTLVIMGAMATSMFAGGSALGLNPQGRNPANPCHLGGFADCESRPQRTVIAQVAS